MRLLTFLAERFWFKSFERTLESVEPEDQDVEREIREAVVVFVHAEAQDAEDAARTFRRTLKHVKWLAGKRQLRNVVLHSFTHLGGQSAEPDFARALLQQLRERLEQTGYQVTTTPFGYVCEWDLKVYGESLAKVYKAF